MGDGTFYAILYVEINLVAMILVGIIGFKTNGLSKMVAQRNFAMSIGAEIFFFLSDTLYVMSVRGFFPSTAWLTMTFKTVYFFSTTLMCYFWFVYFEHMQDSPFVKNRRRVRISSILVWIMGVLLIVNLFTGILFYVDADGVYQRGTLFIIQYILSYVYVLFTCFRALIGVFQKGKLADRKKLIMLALFPIAPAGAGIVQFLYPELPLAAATLSLATLILYLSWIDQMIALDPLTRLYNRKQLAYRYESWKENEESGKELYLMLVDANKFKSINDNYGHIEGDAALIRIADALRLGCREYHHRSSIARYGGDEFVVPAWADRENEEPFRENEEHLRENNVHFRENEELLWLKDRIREHLRCLNEEAAAPYDLTVSIGSARAGQGISLKDLVALADEQLYEEKRRQR